MKLFIFDVYQMNQHIRTEKVAAPHEEAAYAEMEIRFFLLDEPCLEYELVESGEACPLCPDDDPEMVSDGHSVDGIGCCEWCSMANKLFA